METPASIVVEKVVEDRIEELLKAFKNNPPHKVGHDFQKRYEISLNSHTMAQIYAIWIKKNTYSWTVTYKKLQETEWWGSVEKSIKKRTQEDVANFIYEHFKKEQEKDHVKD